MQCLKIMVVKNINKKINMIFRENFFYLDFKIIVLIVSLLYS